MTKVLLVEDDELIYRLYQKLFKHEGYEIETAIDGQAGLDKLGEFKPDIILLDIMMPNMNGLEMLTKLKEDDATKAIPVVVLTNVADIGIANQALERGAALCIVKSQTEPDQVVDSVKAVLARAAGGHGADR